MDHEIGESVSWLFFWDKGKKSSWSIMFIQGSGVNNLFFWFRAQNDSKITVLHQVKLLTEERFPAKAEWKVFDLEKNWPYPSGLGKPTDVFPHLWACQWGSHVVQRLYIYYPQFGIRRSQRWKACGYIVSNFYTTLKHIILATNRYVGQNLMSVSFLREKCKMITW